MTSLTRPSTAVRWSRSFIPTRREAPADAQFVSHKLLLRAGLARQLASGIFSMLPLGERVRRRIAEIVRDEMEAIGGQQFHLPALHPADVWQESGRWDVMGENMFRLRDRHGAALGLGMTHEEIFAAIARDELRSYKQLPQIWFQIQTKFRDEERPKAGLLRVREFLMKDSYSFDLDREGLDRSFAAHRDAYRRIFDRCGLRYVAVEASSGAMGGSESTEFMVKTDAGEDTIAVCASCGYAANTEKATARVAPADDAEGPEAPEKFSTPGVRTIEALTTFPGGAPADRQIKTLVYWADDRKVLALVRGDHELNPTKLADTLGAHAVWPALEPEIREALGAGPGSLGAVGVRTPQVVADVALGGRTNMTTGANEDDFHLRGVSIERDIEVGLWADLRTVKAGDGCSSCEGRLDVFKAVEIGHIFKLGTRYSEALGARVLDREGREAPIVMGSYGIGIERVLVAAIELYADDAGIVWPASIAPFDVIVTPVNVRDEAVAAASERLVGELESLGVEVLYDDRDERAGVKFNDADLIGIPVRVTVGPKKLADGLVEVVERAGRTKHDLPIEGAAEAIARIGGQ
jgi:prolyl-tRNA synthetase